MNVSKKEADILAKHKANPEGAMAEFGEEAVDKARFSEAFNAAMLDFRAARHQLMIANVSKDPRRSRKQKQVLLFIKESCVKP